MQKQNSKGTRTQLFQSCTRNIGVTSLHHSPTRIRSFIFAPYNEGREKSSKSEFLIGVAISNRKTAMFMEASILLHPNKNMEAYEILYHLPDKISSTNTYIDNVRAWNLTTISIKSLKMG